MLKPSQKEKVRQMLGGDFDEVSTSNFLSLVSSGLDKSAVARCEEMAQINGPAIVCTRGRSKIYVLRDGYFAYVVKEQLFLIHPKTIKKGRIK